MDTPSVPITFLDNPRAPELLADAASGVIVLNGMVRLTFEALRIDHSTHPGPANRVVIGRLAMPVGAAEQMCRLVLEHIETLRAQALAAAQAPPAPRTVQ